MSMFKKGGLKSIFKKGGLKNLIKGGGGLKGMLKGGLGAVMGSGGGGIASMLLGGEGGGFLDSIMGGGASESAGGAPSSTGPLTKSGKPDMRYKANRIGATTSKSASVAGDVAETASKGKGGLFSKVGNFFGGMAKKAGGFLSKLNPMTYLKKIFTDKGILKKVLSKIPKIGSIANLAMTAYDLYSKGASIGEMKEQGASYQDIGKQLLMTIGDLGGTFLGGMLGTLIGPGPGNILGGVLGGMAGSALAGLIADNVNLEGLGKTVAGIFGEGGGSAPKPATKVEDAIISGQGPIVKTSAGVFQGRPDDVAMLGTKIGAGGGNSEMVNELRAIRQVLSQILAKEGDITLDGIKLGTALSISTRKLQ